MSLRDLGELYPGFGADLSACAKPAAAAAGHGARCPVPGCRTAVQGREWGMRTHLAVVHDIHPQESG